jgi:hypothetical protein
MYECIVTGRPQLWLNRVVTDWTCIHTRGYTCAQCMGWPQVACACLWLIGYAYFQGCPRLSPVVSTLTLYWTNICVRMHAHTCIVYPLLFAGQNMHAWNVVRTCMTQEFPALFGHNYSPASRIVCHHLLCNYALKPVSDTCVPITETWEIGFRSD